MGQIPSINRENVRLVALWILLIILIVMGWHFVNARLHMVTCVENNENCGNPEMGIRSRAA